MLFFFSESFAYRLKDEDVTVSGGIITRCVYDINKGGNIIEIPDKLQNQTIIGIGDYAFQIAGKIAVLTLPSTLKTIGRGVFEGHALTSLEIPSGVTSIGYRAFYGNALSSINLPAGLMEIGDGAFGYNRLTGITLPAGLTSIGSRTFENNQLTNLTLPNGLTSIGYSAFLDNKITSLTVPNSVEFIGSSAFSNNNISTLNFQQGCQLQEISRNCFSGNKIKNLAIPNSVLVIQDYAFRENRNLSNLTFETNLLKIKEGAFYSCNLSAISLPGSLVFIGKNVFADNSSLGSIKLPISVQNYKWNDSNGDKHNAGDNITNKYNSYVAIIPYTLKDEDVEVVDGIVINCSYFNDFTDFASIITIPDKLDGQDIVGISIGVFYDCGISEVVLPAGIMSIESRAFSRNEIINITLPNSLETIGEEAFHYNCINSISFEATSNLEIIGTNAFSSNRLNNIDFPKNVTQIGKYAFAYNILQNVSFEENSKLVSIGSHAFEGNWQLEDFTLPDPKVNGYDYWLDWDNNNYSSNLIVDNFESFYKIPIEYTLTNDDVVVENGVIIGYTPGNQYANILNIPDVLDGEKIIGIGAEVFRELGIIGVNLPSVLRTIGIRAFAENEIIDVTIPASVEEIEGNAFYRNNINDLTFEENSNLSEIGQWAFYGNKISSLVLPESLNSIYGYAFSYNKITTGINIPDNVEYIGWGAFNGNQIPQLYFSENSTLTYLGESAFSNNNISNEIFIPLTLTEISNYAFRGNNISKVVLHEGIVEYGNGAFDYNDPSLTIVLHEPPTIPHVTHFFGWKDNDGIYYESGVVISDFSNRYKAVIDQFFVVKFIVTDNNNDPVENASIQFYGSTLSTDVNGIDSIGPVLRGLQNYEISAPGCYTVSSSVDVQDNMTIYITLVKYYNANIKIIDKNDNPITGASVAINDTTLLSNTSGNTKIVLSNGEYPFVVNASGYQEYPFSLTVLDSDTSIIVKLVSVLVNYFPNRGTGNSYTKTTDGNTYIIDNNPFSRTAYTFSHWNTEEDDSGTTYVENESITLGYSDIDIYAIWTPVDYAIIYHLEGGTNDSGNPAIYNIESEINLLPANKPSLYFASWINSDGNRVNRIEKGTTGDIELWAVFTTEPTYYIDYYNLENASHNNQSTYTKFDLQLVFTDANKRGYQFIAWYEDALFTKQITTIPVGSTINYDIYAKWGGAVEYTIFYDLDGGLNNVANPDKYTIESDKIIFEPPSKTGAKFLAWFNDESLINEITEIPQSSIGDTTIYAKWELDTFNIQYVLDGGINSLANPAKYTIESNNIVFEPPTKIGAKFIAWYKDQDFTNEISEISKGSFGDETIYAKWELDRYTIQYVLDGGDNNPENPAEYTIESDWIEFKIASKPGANFIAWYRDESLLNEITQIPQGSIGDTIIYAKWELDTFNIQYVLDGGNNSLANPSKYTIESNTIVLENPDKSGYIFDGWFTNSNYLNSINSIQKGSVGDITIYAHWLEIFEVKFIITTDAVNPAKDIDIVFNDTQKLKSDVLGLADTLLPDGSSLNYSIEINGIVINTGSATVSGSDVTIRIEIVDCYMRWYDVIFCDNGKGLWTDFVWSKNNSSISSEQFFHNPGGIENGKYKLSVTSIAGIEYIWEKEYKSDNFEVNVFPNPVQKSSNLNIKIPEKINLQNATILIYSINGALIKKIDNPLYMHEIKIDSKFSSGLYRVVLLDNKNKRNAVKSFIVN